MLEHDLFRKQALTFGILRRCPDSEVCKPLRHPLDANFGLGALVGGASMNVADKGPFDIADFVPQRLLGEGVWGRVCDLDDGTVLKIAHEQCAGIGSGWAKIENECAALTLLAAADALAGLVPVVRERGDIPSSSPLAEEGFAVWLRMTKVSGRTI